MDDPRGRQAAFNASSRDQWDTFAGHRRAVSALLGSGSGAGADVGASPGRGRLCVLGAGNGNDLDLPALLAAHREVHLVDLDAEALARGATRQGVAGHPGLRLLGGVDLTGMLGAVAGWTPGTPIGPEDVAALAEAPDRFVRPALGGPFDRVASTCLLRPLIATAYHAVGERHPRFPELVRAIRAGHLRLLARLAAPGGRAVLITDLVSSDTVPGLGTLPESALPGLLTRLEPERNVFHGVSPPALRRAFLAAALEAGAPDVEAAPPWRWRLHARDYLVWALSCRIPATR